MSIPTLLTPTECESLLSLNDLELTSILKQLSPEKQSSILSQLANHSPLTNHERQIERNIEQYYPHVLSRRQRVFIGIDDEEAFYGGAAGGGKSDALICAALQYIHVPGYAAVLFRRTSPNMEEIVQRTHEWFAGKADWNGQKNRWTFPSGARLYLGHMQHENDKFNWKGFEFQYISFDEVTEFSETQFTYLFSRLRRPKCNRHKVHKEDCATCRRAALLGMVPLRMRSASNPDGEGRDWVKARNVSDEAAAAICTGNYGTLYWNTSPDGHRIPFVPSRAEDNPGLDAESYFDKSLARLDPVTRERLKVGDWIIRADGLIRQEWLRYFEMRGQHIQLLDKEGKVWAYCDERDPGCRRFITVDPAGTSAERSKEAKGKPHSWTVAQVWDMLPPKFGQTLILRDQWRARVDFPGLLAGITKLYKQWLPSEVLIENEKLGVAAVPMLQGTMPITCCNTGGKDKVTRASPLLNMLQKGQVYLPRYDADWKPGLVAEWLSWQGLEDQVADQIDPASYAAIKATSGSASVIAVDFPFWQSA